MAAKRHQGEGGCTLFCGAELNTTSAGRFHCRVQGARGDRKLLLGSAELGLRHGRQASRSAAPGLSARALLAAGVIPEGEQGSVKIPGAGWSLSGWL